MNYIYRGENQHIYSNVYGQIILLELLLPLLMAPNPKFGYCNWCSKDSQENDYSKRFSLLNVYYGFLSDHTILLRVGRGMSYIAHYSCSKFDGSQGF